MATLRLQRHIFLSDHNLILLSVNFLSVTAESYTGTLRVCWSLRPQTSMTADLHADTPQMPAPNLNCHPPVKDGDGAMKAELRILKK